MIRSEALRNLRSGTTRGIAFGLAWFVIAASVLVWNALATEAVQRDAQRYRSAGAATLVVEQPGGIDGHRCESLRALPGVRDAGAFRQADAPVSPLRTPGVDLPTFDVTPGAVALLLDGEPDATTDGVLVSAEVAEALSLRAGETLHTAAGELAISGMFAYPDDGRKAGLGYAAVQTVPATGTFDECRVAIWPESEQVRAIVSVSVLSDAAPADASPVIGQLNPTLGAGFDGAARFRTRPTALLPLVALVGTAALGFIAVRLRRLELASARGVGVGLRAQVMQVTIETLVWLGSAAVGAFLVGVAVGAMLTPGAVATTAEYAAIVLPGGTLAGLAGALVAVASTSPSRLHAYFRDR
jgi:hypothetical protein